MYAVIKGSQIRMLAGQWQVQSFIFTKKKERKESSDYSFTEGEIGKHKDITKCKKHVIISVKNLLGSKFLHYKLFKNNRRPSDLSNELYICRRLACHLVAEGRACT